MSERTKTELTVILHADVAGSTTLVQRNETLAHERLRDCFERFSRTIDSYGGKAREIRGDALVATFNRASDAVCAAAAFQHDNCNHNDALDDEIRPEVRVGIALGEVVVADGTITGAGVVLAQRLEQLAQPHGLVLQSSVRETVPARLPFTFDSLGEHSLKGFDHPVTAFSAITTAGKAIPPPEQHPSATAAADAPPDLRAMHKPSIAVLAFDNVSNDPEQEYFVDGVVEDIITELSRDRDLFVIARNSSFAYKGRSTDIRTIAAELGVQYVLEGSIRRAGTRIRVTAQLIEGESNRHVWAERYDRSIDDIFEVQDELTYTIRNNLSNRVRDSEFERVLRRPTQNLDAYEHAARAMALLYRANAENCPEAIREARAALTIDPDMSRAHAALSFAHLYTYFAGLSDDPVALLDQAYASAREAVDKDRENYWALLALGFVHLFREEHSRALTALDQAVALNPSSADSHAARGMILNYLDRAEEGLAEAQLAVRHNPHHPDWYLSGLGRSLLLLERYDEAIPYLERLASAKGEVLVWGGPLVSAYMAAGRVHDAHAQMSKLLEQHPNATLSTYRRLLPFNNPERLDQVIELMRKAGMPE